MALPVSTLETNQAIGTLPRCPIVLQPAATQLKTLLFATPGIAMAQTLQPSYAIPTFASLSHSNWPSDSKWAALNNSVGGLLQTLRPWAAVCYSSDPLYNGEECQSVLARYVNDTEVCLFICIVCCARGWDVDLDYFSAKKFLRHFCGRTGRRAVITRAAL